MHLNTHSYFSLRYGVLSTERLIDWALEKGHTSLALTDINNTSGLLEFVQKARTKGLKPILGIEFRTDGRLDYIGIAKNDNGYFQLNTFLSKHLHEAALGINQNPSPEEPVDTSPAYTQQGRSQSPDTHSAYINHQGREPQYADDPIPEGPGSVLPSHLKELRFPDRAPDLEDTVFIYPMHRAPDPGTLRKNEYVGIRPSELNKLFSSPLKAHPDKLVCLLPVTFSSRDEYNTHRLLRAIDHNTLLSKLDPEDTAAADEYMYSLKEFIEFYATHPHLVTNTQRILEECHFNMVLKSPKNKTYFTTSEQSDYILLRKLAQDGFSVRYQRNDRVAQARMDSELQVIREMGFCAYFLITWDFIQYAKSRGFFHVGRGSGANSIVAYCMGITEVDPIRLNLYFERFLNIHRTSPPDFDIDFSWADRDAVIDYIFKRYDHQHTAFVATYVCFQGRSIIRELGKVFGLPKEEIDGLIMNRPSPRTDDRVVKAIWKYAQILDGLPNYLGMHPGGILISEKPIHHYAATGVPPKGFPVIQLDMFAAEDVGLFKYDVLSQRGLGHIRTTAEVVRRNKRQYVDVMDVNTFMADPKIADLLRNGRTIGCFYVESPAMRQLLRKLRCDNYPTLVAASSVIRPGVARSGMMKQYIERHLYLTAPQYLPAKNAMRKQDTETAKKSWYLHPSMEEYLGETYGVMVYQEDVIKVAHYFGGVGLGEADVLRRAMSGKYRSFNEFKSLKDRFFSNCAGKGIDEAVTTEVWRQMESFAGYSFCKAHSASFAVESYQSLHLKAYHPLEFMVGVINNFGGFYRTEVYVHEARMAGGTIHAPCVNHSEHLTLVHGKELYLGFIHVKGLQSDLVEAILTARRQGPFTSLADFIARVPSMGHQQGIILVRVGALRFTGKSKKNLLWELGMHFSKAPVHRQSTTLFQMEDANWKIPPLADTVVEDAYDEMELLGFPLLSPFELATVNAVPGETFASEMINRHGQTVTLRGYLIATKTVRTIKGDLMGFVDFIDAQGEFFGAVLFPDTYSQNVTPGIGVYKITGKVIDEYGIPNLEVKEIERLPYRVDPRYDVGREGTVFALVG